LPFGNNASIHGLASYFDLKSSPPRGSPGRRGCWEVGVVADHAVWVAARVVIFTRLWVKTPCPHQMRAPARPSRPVWFQP
jgi:hypothetical protein